MNEWMNEWVLYWTVTLIYSKHCVIKRAVFYLIIIYGVLQGPGVIWWDWWVGGGEVSVADIASSRPGDAMWYFIIVS
jgi:hypothetical protein